MIVAFSFIVPAPAASLYVGGTNGGAVAFGTVLWDFKQALPPIKSIYLNSWVVNQVTAADNQPVNEASIGLILQDATGNPMTAFGGSGTNAFAGSILTTATTVGLMKDAPVPLGGLTNVSKIQINNYSARWTTAIAGGNAYALFNMIIECETKNAR